MTHFYSFWLLKKLLAIRHPHHNAILTFTISKFRSCLSMSRPCPRFGWLAVQNYIDFFEHDVCPKTKPITAYHFDTTRTNQPARQHLNKYLYICWSNKQQRQKIPYRPRFLTYCPTGQMSTDNMLSALSIACYHNDRCESIEVVILPVWITKTDMLRPVVFWLSLV